MMKYERTERDQKIGWEPMKNNWKEYCREDSDHDICVLRSLHFAMSSKTIESINIYANIQVE